MSQTQGGQPMTNLNFTRDKTPSNCFLTGIAQGKRTLNFSKNETVFSQGEPADAVYYIREGRVKLTVVSFGGKEATLSVLGMGDFFGVCCLGDQKERSTTASTLEPSTIVSIEKDAMLRALRQRPEILETLMAYLLKRTVNLQKDLCTQILDPSEKRLARILLRLTQSTIPEEHEEHKECISMPKLSHDTLATMVGTTRSRVTYFMNKFKNQGFIDYDKGIMVRPMELSSMLQEDF
jgi:CRP/FNR family transcriptional regulator, cyclic AMP receptor protein